MLKHVAKASTCHKRQETTQSKSLRLSIPWHKWRTSVLVVGGLKSLDNQMTNETSVITSTAPPLGNCQGTALLLKTKTTQNQKWTEGTETTDPIFHLKTSSSNLEIHHTDQQQNLELVTSEVVAKPIHAAKPNTIPEMASNISNQRKRPKQNHACSNNRSKSNQKQPQAAKVEGRYRHIVRQSV